MFVLTIQASGTLFPRSSVIFVAEPSFLSHFMQVGDGTMINSCPGCRLPLPCKKVNESIRKGISRHVKNSSI